MATWNTRGLRGSTLEDMVNRTNEKYAEAGLALIQKIPTPITPVKMDKESRQITLAFFEHSIDANRGDYQNGWDTDQFPIDNYELTQAMMQIIRNGGLGTGGTNFDAKTRRNSTDLEDIFIAHIAGMDAMARALESAAALLNESPYKKMLADRYASFDGGKGKEFEDGKLTLEDVVAYAKTKGEPKQTSGKQELYEAILNMYC